MPEPTRRERIRNLALTVIAVLCLVGTLAAFLVALARLRAHLIVPLAHLEDSVSKVCAGEPGATLSLRDTGVRVWPYYIHMMQPHVLRGERMLVAAHGNSLRALIMALEGLSPDEVVKLELATGVPIVYRLNADSTIASKDVLED